MAQLCVGHVLSDEFGIFQKNHTVFHPARIVEQHRLVILRHGKQPLVDIRCGIMADCIIQRFHRSHGLIQPVCHLSGKEIEIGGIL